MNEAIAGALSFFYDIVPSYGFAIVMLTLAVMVLLTPLTLSGTRSMMNMQRLQPEIAALRDKHKDDPQALNEATIQLYKDSGVNPLLGCLPLLVQMPVFIVLFNVLRGITNRAGGLGSAAGNAAGLVGRTPEASEFAEWTPTFEPSHLDTGSKMFSDLSSSTEMTSLGIDMALSPQGALSKGILVALPFIAMVIIVGITSWYQQQQVQARQSPAAQQSPQAAQQQMIMKFLPWMLPIFSVTMPAGLVVYFIVSNLYRVGQQGFINRSIAAERGTEVESPLKTRRAESAARSSDARRSAKSRGSSSKGSDGRPRSRNQPKRDRGGASGATPPVTPRQRKQKRKKKRN